MNKSFADNRLNVPNEDNLSMMKNLWNSFKNSRDKSPKNGQNNSMNMSNSRFQLENDTRNSHYLKDVTRGMLNKSKKPDIGFYSSNHSMSNYGGANYYSCNLNNSIDNSKTRINDYSNRKNMDSKKEVQKSILMCKIDQINIDTPSRKTKSSPRRSAIFNTSSNPNYELTKGGNESSQAYIPKKSVDYEKARQIVTDQQDENTVLKKKLASQKYEYRAIKKELGQYKKIAKEFNKMDSDTVNLNIKVKLLETDIKRLTTLLNKTEKHKEIAESLEAKENLTYIKRKASNKENRGTENKLPKKRSLSRGSIKSLSKYQAKPVNLCNSSFKRPCCGTNCCNNADCGESYNHPKAANKSISWQELANWIPGEAKNLALIFKNKYLPKVSDSCIIEFIRKINEIFLQNEEKVVKKLNADWKNNVNELKMKNLYISGDKYSKEKFVHKQNSIKKAGFMEGSLWIINKLSQDILKMQKQIDVQASTNLIFGAQDPDTMKLADDFSSNLTKIYNKLSKYQKYIGCQKSATMKKSKDKSPNIIISNSKDSNIDSVSEYSDSFSKISVDISF